MDLSWRYAVIVQVVSRGGRDLFYGFAPEFGIETYEAIDPGNISQEYMFHLKLRRMIGEALSVCRAEQKEPPVIREGSHLAYSRPTSEDIRSCEPASLISTSEAAKALGVHPDTIRQLFDEGRLKGSLTLGKHRMILVSSLEQEKAKRAQRASLRQFELRAKRKNEKRKERRIQKVREEKIQRVKADSLL